MAPWGSLLWKIWMGEWDRETSDLVWDLSHKYRSSHRDLVTASSNRRIISLQRWICSMLGVILMMLRNNSRRLQRVRIQSIDVCIYYLLIRCSRKTNHTAAEKTCLQETQRHECGHHCEIPDMAQTSNKTRKYYIDIAIWSGDEVLFLIAVIQYWKHLLIPAFYPPNSIRHQIVLQCTSSQAL